MLDASPTARRLRSSSPHATNRRRPARDGDRRRRRVTFDNSAGSLPETNHLDRPEVAEALARGTGFTIRRHSESTDLYYFYSAMSDGGVVVRSAVPYSITLREVLAADREFLWFMLGVTLLMSVAAYFATRRLGHNITRLRDFAQPRRAGRADR